MPVDWMDVSEISFNALLLLERAQLAWFPNWPFPRPALALALAANPAVTWYIEHKCPEVAPWLAAECAQGQALLHGDPAPTLGTIRAAEVAVLGCLTDLLVYVLDPAIYDRQPFLAWESSELTSLVDFQGKVVLDIGSGTGRLAFTAAPLARVVYAVEPVANLRDYLRQKAARLGLSNVYPVDGLITRIPFADGFADVVMGGHVFGDEPAAEWAELLRVTRPGGMVILCPGNGDRENAAHQTLVGQGAAWARFEEPGVGWLRKYWLKKAE